MFQGFYNLTSGVLTQNRNLNVISNNMTNATTPGYKSDTYVATTFKEELMNRSGNKVNNPRTNIGTMAMVRTSSETVADYEQGSFDSTNGTFDFALTNPGFFVVQTNQGMGYTRNGSFILDDQGYLALPSVGRVQGENGPIQLNTDNIIVDSSGRIFNEEGTQYFGRLSVVDFADYSQLDKQNNGVYTTNAAAVPTDTEVKWRYLEASNVDAIKEMTNMMSSQRSLQSAAQVLKMYDQLMGKIVTEIGRA